MPTATFSIQMGNFGFGVHSISEAAAYAVIDPQIILAIDADLTNNKSFVPGYESKFIGGVLNIHPYSWLSLRAGAMCNVKDSEEGMILTAGLGFGLRWLQLDLAGQMSSKKTKFNHKEISNYMRLQVSPVSKW